MDNDPLSNGGAMEHEEVTGEGRTISRRKMIAGTLGAAGAVWAAPAIASIGSSAYAATPQCPGQDWNCNGPFVTCGSSGQLQLCVCDVTTEGNTFCWENFFCGTTPICASSADCAALPGYACVT